jgi:flagellar biosynthesis/type III secretory pathway protein FliH
MSRIIKSGDATAVSPVASMMEAPDMAAAPTRRDEELQALLARIAQLEAELRRREAIAGDLEAAAERAREDGREQGYECGLIAAQDRQSERLALLESAMNRAHAALGENAQALGRLAPLLAQECVEILLGNASDRAGIVAEIARKQLARVDRAMLVDVRVSRLDFPDDEALAMLAGRLGLTAMTVNAGDDIASGGCTMVMRLGRIEVGIDQQWPVLRDLLGEISAPEAVP